MSTPARQCHPARNRSLTARLSAEDHTLTDEEVEKTLEGSSIG
jgi:hypothetical protein